MSRAQFGKAVRLDVSSGTEAYENAPYPWNPLLRRTFKTDANSLTACAVKLFVHIEFSNLEQQEPNNAKL